MLFRSEALGAVHRPADPCAVAVGPDRELRGVVRLERLQEIELDRDARRMVVRELQLAGEDEAAQRAAVEWLHVAPNAGDYHRLAATVDPPGVSAQQEIGAPFYSAYRRDVSEIVRESAHQDPLTSAAILMEEHVAIARPDGSVSLYVHTVKRIASDPKDQQADIAVPREAQLLTLRIVHADGTLGPINELAQESDRKSVV